MREPCGIVLIDKPAGPTSRQVAESVGRLLRPESRRSAPGALRFRVGHAGTLDPLATGLLVVLVGRGTRLAPFLQGLDKRYLATVRFGTATDTHDRDGEVTGRSPVPARPDELAAALAALRRATLQVPPVISSLKQGGRSLHRLARAGREVTPPAPRPVRIDSLEATAVRWPLVDAVNGDGHAAPDGLVYEVDLDVACGSGTYVRALARDLAAALGTLGHVHALRRLAVGPFRVQEAVGLAALAAAAEPGACLRPLVAALPHLAAFELDAQRAARVRHGGQPEPDWLPGPTPPEFRLVDPVGRLVAVGRTEPVNGRPLAVVVFPEEAEAAAEAGPCA